MITLFFITLISLFFILYFNSNFNKLLGFIFLFISFFVIALNRSNQDYEGYESIFEDPSGYAEIGFVWLIELLKFIGFEGHYSVLLSFSMLYIFTFIRLMHYIKNIYLAVIFYFIFLMPIDITQIRFAISYFLFINSLLYLNSKYKIISLIFLLASLALHYSSIIFLIIILFYFMNVFAHFKIIKSVIASLVLSFSFGYILFAIDILGIPVRTLGNYFSDELKFHSFVIWILPIIIIISVYKHCEKFIGRNDESVIHLYNIFIAVSSLSIIFSFGLLHLYEFNRIYRAILLILSLAGVILVDQIDGKRKKIYLSLFIFIWNLIFGLYYSSVLNFDSIYWSYFKFF
jgi:hypothetical protein